MPLLSLYCIYTSSDIQCALKIIPALGILGSDMLNGEVVYILWQAWQAEALVCCALVNWVSGKRGTDYML